jgi:hypothetical protein
LARNESGDIIRKCEEISQISNNIIEIYQRCNHKHKDNVGHATLPFTSRAIHTSIFLSLLATSLSSICCSPLKSPLDIYPSLWYSLVGGLFFDLTYGLQ